MYLVYITLVQCLGGWQKSIYQEHKFRLGLCGTYISWKTYALCPKDHLKCLLCNNNSQAKHEGILNSSVYFLSKASSLEKFDFMKKHFNRNEFDPCMYTTVYTNKTVMIIWHLEIEKPNSSHYLLSGSGSVFCHSFSLSNNVCMVLLIIRTLSIFFPQWC